MKFSQLGWFVPISNGNYCQLAQDIVEKIIFYTHVFLHCAKQGSLNG